MKAATLIACHECDLLHEIKPLPEGGVAQCSRCGAVLLRHKRNSLDRTLAFAMAGLILIIVANTFPFLALEEEGLVQETTLITGVEELYREGRPELAMLVFLTSILLPFVHITGLLYLLVPLKLNRLPWKLPLAFRFLGTIQPWGMMEVFMLGILVSMVKLGKMATIVPGIALYSFVVLIFVLAAANASLDAHMVWERLDKPHE
jgi:paraquat-inducible protein A